MPNNIKKQGLIVFITIIIIIFAIKFVEAMNDIAINNPFVVGKYLSDKYFCDRIEETEFLRKQLQNGRDVALISPRRIGKSGKVSGAVTDIIAGGKCRGGGGGDEC